MAETSVAATGSDELATLKLIALEGGLSGEIKVSCSSLGDKLNASTQTASRRLRRLESAALIERDTVTDGQWVEITTEGERTLRGEYEQYRRMFERDVKVRLSGIVTSGMGEGVHYISLPGYAAQFESRLEYSPFPGTLNIELHDNSIRRRGAFFSLEPIPIDGWEDDERTYGPARCYPARVETVDGDTFEQAHAIVPERTHHDDDKLELIAPTKLRDALDLHDGDMVKIIVSGANE